MIKRALLSVADKTGLQELAQALVARDIEILSTGGTASFLRDAGIAVIDVSDVTGYPEIMNGRVKTLHPRIHAGILARRAQDQETLDKHEITPIDLVVVNLYPFTQVVAQPNCQLSDAIENIDIGGPCMLRAAAKNYLDVTVLTDIADYSGLMRELDMHDGKTSLAFRSRLAQKVFALTASYDAAIANYLGSQTQTTAPLVLHAEHQQDLRYGENPHQQATFYQFANAPQTGTIANAKQLQGKALSYNNIADADAALACVKAFRELPACVIVKHANPCGVALATTQEQAYQRAFATDPTSAFGGIIAFNQELDAATAQAIVQQQFVEVIIAPSIHPAARKVLAEKQNLRMLTVGTWPEQMPRATHIKSVAGGLLVQDEDIMGLDISACEVVTQQQPTPAQRKDCLFAWQVAKYVKSNAIVYAADQATVGIGAGQMSRVVSAKIAGFKAEEAGLSVPGAVMASDAFFPFRDGIDAAAAAGIKAIIQPGGSKRDAEVIAAANEAGIAMMFTGIRHFRH